MPRFLGLDVGTSSLKALLVDETGAVLARVSPEYDFVTPRALWAESDPEDWWQAAITAIRTLVQQVGAEDIAAIGLTGQMHGLVMLDGAGKVLRPCIMWNDQRSALQCAALTEKIGTARVLELTGNPVLPGFTAPKATWVRDNEPEVFAKTAKILLPKDYLRYRLSGVFATDLSDASGMALVDVAKRQWSEEMLAACEIPRQWLAELTESPVASARLNAEAAAATGLPEGLPIAAGAGDQAAQAVGSGIVREGLVSATLGTSGVVFAHSDAYRVEPEGRLHAFCCAVPGKWHLMGVMLSAAGSYAWLRETLDDDYDQLNALAAEVSPGAENLLFLPYLSGERTPHPDPHARGCFVGLTLRHGKGHLARSVLEGVSFGMRDGLELMSSLGIVPRQIVASGGGVTSPLWRQILADVFGLPLVTMNVSEGAAYGAALLGAVAGGLFPSVEAACDATLRATGETWPGPDVPTYKELYPHYQALYPALKERFAALGS